MATNLPFKKRLNPIGNQNEEKEESFAPQKPLKTRLKEKPERQKYTATMRKDLHRRIKVAAAMRGVQLSTFIEDACMEKLDREGR